MTLVAVVAIGCSHQNVPDPDASPFQPDTDLGFRVEWPGQPEIASDRVVGPGGVLEVYSATYLRKDAERTILFAAHVSDFGPQAANDMSPRERLTAFKYAFQEEEVSRKEIEHDPKKFPGLDIVRRRAGKASREIVVAAGTRIISVRVVTSNEEMLASPEVAAFFDSFLVER